MRVLSLSFIIAVGGVSLASFLTSATFQTVENLPDFSSQTEVVVTYIEAALVTD